MPVRGWQRTMNDALFQPPSYAQAFSPTVLNVLYPNTEDDTLVRVLLDVTCTITCRDTNGDGNPGADWWGHMHPVVGVGRVDYPGLGILTLFGLPDKKVTGTSMLRLQDVTQALGSPSTHTAHYALAETLDTHGQRKPLTPGVSPAANSTINVHQDIAEFDPTILFSVAWTGYLRALWETP